MEKPTVEELASRMQEDITWFKGTLPERTASAWYGYLAALVEWGLISVAAHDRLCDMLPPIEDNPAVQILLGRLVGDPSASAGTSDGEKR